MKMIKDELTGLYYPETSINVERLESKRVYISGKITGIENKARQVFKKAQQHFTDLGIEALNPFEFNHDHNKSWESYMRVCILELMNCDAIYMLPGWKNSKGAKLEYKIAKALGLLIIDGKTKNIKTKADVYTMKLKYAQSLGFKGVAEAISEMGAFMFNKQFRSSNTTIK